MSRVATLLPRGGAGTAAWERLERLRLGSSSPSYFVAGFLSRQCRRLATGRRQELQTPSGLPNNRGQSYRADSPGLPFAELGIAEVATKVGGVRVRQHSNPLKRELQVPARPPDWESVYDEPHRPLVLDIGSGYGRFLLMLDRHMTDEAHNFLGLELRRPIVKRANLWAEELGQSRRVNFLYANGTGKLNLVTIQFPDPHVKKKHGKRRIVQKQLVEAIGRHLVPGGRLFLQSDMEKVVADMRDNFERHGGDLFEIAPEHLAGPCSSCSNLMDTDSEQPTVADAWTSDWAKYGWLGKNPLGVPTEREVYTLEGGLPVYRIMLKRR